MLIINGKSFRNERVENEARLSIGEGSYRAYKNRIIFRNNEGRVFIALVNNKDGLVGFVLASERDGKILYMHSCNAYDEEYFDIPKSSIEAREYATKIFNQVQ